MGVAQSIGYGSATPTAAKDADATVSAGTPAAVAESPSASAASTRRASLSTSSASPSSSSSPSSAASSARTPARASALPAPPFSDSAYWRRAVENAQLDLRVFGVALAEPWAELTEESYAELAIVLLESYPALSALRHKLVPSRVDERCFWAALFCEVHRQASGAPSRHSPALQSTSSLPKSAQRPARAAGHESAATSPIRSAAAELAAAAPSDSAPSPADAAQLAELQHALSVRDADLAARANDCRELEGIVAARDVDVAARDAEILYLRHQLDALTRQLGAVSRALTGAFAIADAEDSAEVERQLELHASHPPGPHELLQQRPPSTPCQSPANVASAAAASQLSPAPAPSAPATVKCSRCSATLPSTSASGPCLCHSGSWVLSKDSVEFFALPPELRENLRKEKARRLAVVQKELRFIISSDAEADAPGSWSCCSGDEYPAAGCSKQDKHAIS